MYSTGRNTFLTRRCDTLLHLTVALFCIQMNDLYATTLLGDKSIHPAHINNLYNTIFWALVQQGGKTAAEAHATLRGTASAAKHEMLFQQFNINYNDISDRYKRGSVLVRVPRDAPEIASKTSTGHTVTEQVSTDEPAGGKKRARAMVEVLHCDIVRDEFWKARSYILAG